MLGQNLLNSLQMIQFEGPISLDSTSIRFSSWRLGPIKRGNVLEICWLPLSSSYSPVPQDLRVGAQVQEADCRGRMGRGVRRRRHRRRDRRRLRREDFRWLRIRLQVFSRVESFPQIGFSWGCGNSPQPGCGITEPRLHASIFYSDKEDVKSKGIPLPPQLVGEGLPEHDSKWAVVAKGEFACSDQDRRLSKNYKTAFTGWDSALS